MSYCVNLSVVFQWDDHEKLHPIVHACLPKVKEEGLKEAVWYLEALLERKGKIPGPKGGMSTWGMVCNYTPGDAFVKALAPFWFLVLDHVWSTYSRIMVFAQGEDDGYAVAYEIYREDPEDENSMTVRKHKCPFSWLSNGQQIEGL